MKQRKVKTDGIHGTARRHATFNGGRLRWSGLLLVLLGAAALFSTLIADGHFGLQRAISFLLIGGGWMMLAFTIVMERRDRNS